MNQTTDQGVSRRRWMSSVAMPGVALAAGQVLFAGGAVGVAAAPAAANTLLSGARVYNVRDFGATGDGTTLDTAALQAAIDACTGDQGGTVLVPAGVFVIGTVQLKSNVTLHLASGAKILGSGDGKQYHAVDQIPLNGDSTLGDGNVALLFAADAANVCIEGLGTLDGQGARFHSAVRGKLPPAGIGGSHRPYTLLFYRCRNLVLRDFELVDSAFHAIRIIQSRYVRADGIHVHSRVNSNNDGFHFISAQHVTISNCSIECQDDACALFGSCQYVTVTNCSFSTRWSVFRFGGGNVSNIAVSNCLIYQAYGCPIKIRCGPGSVFEYMSFSNLIMQDVTGPISIGVGPQTRRPRSASGPASNPAQEMPATARSDEERGHGVLRHISFSNIQASVPSTPQQLPGQPFTTQYRGGEIRSCIALNGVDDAYLEDISLTDVRIVYGGGGTAAEAANRDVPKHAGEYFELGTLPAYGLYARNVRGLTLRNVRFEVEQPDLRCAVVCERVEDGAIDGLTVQANPEAESALRFTDVEQVLVSAPRILGRAATYLKVEGSATAELVVQGGDLSRAARTVTADASVPAGATRVGG